MNTNEKTKKIVCPNCGYVIYGDRPGDWLECPGCRYRIHINR
jgi:DNA-directed RNA polymerase subunit RPC12/RpoP